jgi:hypothetical protein
MGTLRHDDDDDDDDVDANDDNSLLRAPHSAIPRATRRRIVIVPVPPHVRALRRKPFYYNLFADKVMFGGLRHRVATSCGTMKTRRKTMNILSKVARMCSTGPAASFGIDSATRALAPGPRRSSLEYDSLPFQPHHYRERKRYCELGTTCSYYCDRRSLYRSSSAPPSWTAQCSLSYDPRASSSSAGQRPATKMAGRFLRRSTGRKFVLDRVLTLSRATKRVARIILE